jgi:hypothetical protein
MLKTPYETPGLGNNIDPILPDGWKEGDDLFAEEALNPVGSPADEQEHPLEELFENENGADSTTNTPTTGDGADDAGRTLDDGGDLLLDGADGATAISPRILKLKVNHKESEVDINSLTDDDLIARLQKAEAFDAMKESQNKALFREVYEEQIASGMTEGVAKMVAANAVGGKTYSLDDDEGTETPVVEKPAPAVARESADFASELQQLMSVFPDFKAMPTEVMTAYANGASLLNAYSAYRAAQSEKAASTLKRENQILKQNAASLAKAPVRGVTGGGATAQPKDDPFLKGFDADNW